MGHKDQQNDTISKVCTECGNASGACHCVPKARVRTKGISPTATLHASKTLEPGELINRRYQVIRQLGKGGMATVYLVRHATEDHLFAMKILKQDLVEDKEANERFEREAQAIRMLRHPNLVSVYDFGKTSNGQAYIVMDYLVGESLFKILQTEKPLGVSRTCRIFLQICDAMAHAHKAGVVHRDLKPSNIILSPDAGKSDLVRIVDFGIAKFARPSTDAQMKLTQDGQIFGSPAYMSPEQCLSGKIDHRADVYSAGCMIFECLTGIQPFAGDYPLAICFKHVNESAPLLRDANPNLEIPAELENIVAKAMAKDPDERYQSIVEMEWKLLEFAVDQKQFEALKAE